MNQRNTILYVVMVLAVLVLLGQFVSLLFPTRDRQMASVTATAEGARPTRTDTPTQTPVPATNTPAPPTPTETPVPPTATQVPSTETPIPPTEGPTETPEAPTLTPAPPTATRIPATRRPPTPVPPPIEVLNSVQVDNGEFGKEGIYVNYREDIYVTAGNGARYRCELGFLSRPESLARTQDYWNWGARGGGNWKMIVLLRAELGGWNHCGDSNVCYQVATNAGQASFTAEVYPKSHVWQSLVDAHLAGGWQAVAGSPYYQEMQEAVFKPICSACGAPGTPILGFKFTQVN